MRPDILNPLFADIRALKGVGPGLAKPLERLGLERVKDVLYHFPNGWTYRKAVSRLDVADVGQNIILTVTVMDHRGGNSPRAPLRIFAADVDGNYITLTFFGRNGGWARKQLPVGETRIISGKLDRYGDELQMVHPDHIVPIGSDASQKHPHTQAASYYFCLIWHVKNVFFPAIISMLCSHYPPIPSA